MEGLSVKEGTDSLEIAPVLVTLIFHKGNLMSKQLKPGMTAPRSGQYENTTTHREVTVTRGEPMPPTPARGQSYKLVDQTKHKR